MKEIAESADRLWIGLYYDINSWRWSIDDTYLYGDGNTEFGNWFNFVVDNYISTESCVVIYGDMLADDPCDDLKNSVCFDGECALFHNIFHSFECNK